MASAPISMKEIVQLPSVGVQPASITFTHTTMESENYILCRVEGAQKELITIDMNNPTAPSRRPMAADSALMNPKENIMALKASGEGGDTLQIFNLGTKQKLKAFLSKAPVVFWRWISDTCLGLVTADSVLHWDMHAPGDPVLMFSRADNLAAAQIISYRVDDAGKWCVLIGIAPGDASRPQLVKGAMQLYSVDAKRSQSLDAHAAAFSTVDQPDGSKATMIAFAQKMSKDGTMVSKLHIIQLGASPPRKQNAELFFPPEFADDFPVSMQISARFGLVYVITKLGLLFVYDLITATAIYRNRISSDPIFLTAPSASTGGFYAINRRGQVMLYTVNEANMVPFVSGQLGQLELALALAKRSNLPGAEALIGQQFEKLLAAGQHKEAAECAAESPQGVLRTKEVMERLKSLPAQPGQKSPILVYFGTLLTRGKLSALESVELASLVLSQNKKELLLNWWKQGKLEPSEALGDILKNADELDTALAVYQKSGAQQKVVACYAEKGDIDALMAASGQQGQTPDYLYLLQSLMMNNPSGAVGLAKRVAKEPGPPLDLNVITDLFLQRNMIKEATAFLLEVLKGDKPEHAALQTKLVEINLITNAQVADMILSNGELSQYDRPRIAQLCEQAGLYMRALEHYTDLPDIKRCLVNTHAINPEQLTEYFGNLSSEWALECLKELLRTNMAGNLQLVVNITKQYASELGTTEIADMFEQLKCPQGLYFFLGAIIFNSEDPEVHLKYIQAAAQTNQIKEVERVTRESNFYPPEKTKTFLMEAKLPDARPLINVCDRHNMVGDLTQYLHANNMLRFIEGYVQKVNPSKTPQVVGGLLDCEAGDDFITNLILSVRALVPVEPLVEEVEKRHRLKLLSPFLEHLVSEGSQDVHVHNAVGKICIDTNNNPDHFLNTNPYYDATVVGKYCERRDPHLACIAYRKRECDDALVDCTNRHSLFKLQARYVVERMDADLWAKVLSEENEHKRQIVDQVVSTALPESSNPEQVSVAVKAFMTAELQSELIELLEKIVLQNSAFSNNSNLQNLLLITAIKSDPSRVKDYINRLHVFDGPAVGEIAVQYALFDEAFEVYKKFDHKVQAVGVLLEHLQDTTRAHEYATKVDEPEVWSALAEALLQGGQVAEAIEAFLRANDGTMHKEVIAAAGEVGCYEELVSYLTMVRSRIKDKTVDSELLYSYARVGDSAALEQFIASSNYADIQASADRVAKEGMHDAARVLYAHIPNWGCLASTLVKLHLFQEAVDAARKANSPKTWKEVCYACVDEQEFRLAQLCGLQIIINADELDGVSQYYQSRGHFDQCIALMESGIGLDRAHMGIFTELGILFARFRPAQLMEHLKLFSARVNIPRLIRVCEDQQHWEELTFLYIQYDEYDNACMVMIHHSPVAWEHTLFKDVCVKVSNMEVQYKAATFYLEEHPDKLVELLRVLESRLDHARVVHIVSKAQQLPLIKDYLLSVQKNNLVEVNDAVNGLLMEEEDYDSLKVSITTYDNFDQLALAAQLEAHELMEFRRIAAFLYKRNLRWRKAVGLAKTDRLFKDAMETAAQSGESAIADDLLRFFVQEGEKECFAAALFTCYDLVQADVVLELAWMHGLTDYIMPFMIQFLKEVSGKMDILMREREENNARNKEAEASEANQQAAANAHLTLMPLALPAPASAMGGGGGMDAPQGFPGYQ